ncbi:hypothetical protein K439DRAFT_1634917, partial [Ramaria rubella]
DLLHVKQTFHQLSYRTAWKGLLGGVVFVTKLYRGISEFSDLNSDPTWVLIGFLIRSFVGRRDGLGRI